MEEKRDKKVYTKEEIWEILDKADAEEEIEFQEAREIMGKNILYRNEDLYTHYQTKVAMTLYDEQNRNNGNCLIDFSELENRNRVADKVLKAIFSKGGNNE